MQPVEPDRVPPTGESPVDRAAKRELATTLNDVFSNTSVVVVAHYAGLKVADMPKLRAKKDGSQKATP